jgi:hypothetical protein
LLSSLQGSQPRRVGGADVDHKVVPQLLEQLEAGQVIGSRFFQRGDFGFAQVNSNGDGTLL